jgi:hypothetical protein
MSESCGGLIISPEELARIRAACLRRGEELEAARTPQPPPDAAGSSQGVDGKLPNLVI